MNLSSLIVKDFQYLEITPLVCLTSILSAAALIRSGRAETKNKYLASPSTSHLAEAKALLDQNGSLSEAALLLEAAIQQGDLGQGGYEAWILLGETRNMDERETAGMRALMEGVRLAEAAGATGEGMLV